MKNSNTQPLTWDDLMELGPLPLDQVLFPEREEAIMAGRARVELYDFLPLLNDPCALASLFYHIVPWTWGAAAYVAIEMTAQPFVASREDADLYAAELALPRSRAEALAARERADARARDLNRLPAWRPRRKAPAPDQPAKAPTTNS